MVVLGCGILRPVHAATSDEIPPELRPWSAWVLADAPDAVCALVDETRTCVWPGSLDLRLEATGGTFTLRVLTENRQFVALPGGRDTWPLDVRVTSPDEATRTVPVLDRGGSPQVELTAGRHTITGAFRWATLPETLNVAATTAFVRIEYDGRPVPFLERDDGRLWLKGLREGTGTGDDADHLELQVYRRIVDGVPMRVETRLVWDVSGRGRELELPTPLVPGTVPVAIHSELPVALDPTGRLRVQLAPGHYETTLVARTIGMPESLEGMARPAPWPAEEVWVWAPAEPLRAVEIRDVVGIDASRTELPGDWAPGSAYVVGPNDRMTLTTHRRGEAQLPPNRLSLRREFWLDERAQTFTVRDHIGGEMHRQWRLDLLAGELGQVTLGGVEQLITLHPGADGSATRGVELRQARVDLQAVSRVPRSPEMAAVGWNENVDVLSAELHLPPGWDVWASRGVDVMHGTWVARWNLFSVFYVLVIALAVGRLVSPVAAIVAALALTLGRGEPGAPEYIWATLVVLFALARAIRPSGWATFFHLAFRGTALVLLVTLVAFAVDQMRHALYPHLRFDDGMNFYEYDRSTYEMPVDAPPPVEESADFAEADVDEMASQQDGSARERWSKKGMSTSVVQQVQQLDEPDARPDAIVQTGPGIPESSGRTWSLQWSGPVARDHTMTLYLVSPTVMRVLTILRLLVTFLLGWWLWRALGPAPVAPPRPQMPPMPGPMPGPHPGPLPTPGDTMRAPVVVGLLAFLLPLSSAWAHEPSSAVLDQLRQRLTKPPACAPACVSVASAELALGEGLVWTAEVHAGTTTGYVLPGPAHVFATPSVEVDGEPAHALRLTAGGAYLLRLDPGVHTVVLRAGLQGDRATLDLGTPPHRLQVRAEGWNVTGLDPRGRAESNSVTVMREIPTSADATTGTRDRGAQITVPPSYRVTRTVVLGVTGRVSTTIERMSDASRPEVLALALLPGEQVTTSGIPTTGGLASIAFPRDGTGASFESTLALDAGQAPFELELVAAGPERDYVESWDVSCTTLWRCTTTGIAPTSHLRDGVAFEHFDPWPGESVRIEAHRPAPAEGQSVTIESATLTLRPGVRMGRGELTFRVRTSRAALHTVTLPASAELEKVAVDGVGQSPRSDDGRVRIALAPGSHDVLVHWQEHDGLASLFETPTVDVGAAGVNHRVVVELPEDRWLLFAHGPARGPAILLWGYLVLLVLAAILLSRLPDSPLSIWGWLLLGLGLVHVPAGVAVFIAAWFFAVAWRPRWVTSVWMTQHEFARDVAQVALIVGTVIFLSFLTGAVYEGLVSSPDMDVEGSGSTSSRLVWYTDRSAGALPHAWVLSVSVWVWRGVMLAWALWLAAALLRWLPWAWQRACEYGFWSPGGWRRSSARKPEHRPPGPV